MIKKDLFYGNKDGPTYTKINVTHNINKRRDETHMITSTDAKKASDKIHHPLRIKTLKVTIQW